MDGSKGIDWTQVWAFAQTVPAWGWALAALAFLLWRERRGNRRALAALERSNDRLTAVLGKANDNLASVAQRALGPADGACGPEEQ